VGASALVALPIYYLQRKADERQQRKATLEMYVLWLDGQGRSELLKKIESQLAVLLEGKSAEDRQQAILAEFQRVDGRLQDSFKKGDSTDYVEEAVAYKALADAWADSAIDTQDFSVLSTDGSLSIDRILGAHQAMFPTGYTWAGRLRTHTVTILGHFNAGSRTVNPMLSSMTTAVVPPDKIAEKLDGLLKRWNTNIQFVVKDSKEARVAELTAFHQEFLLIHPFTDGNGRISRVILNEQATFLFGRAIRCSFPKREYYEALHLADLREPERLRSLLMANIEQDVGPHV
jgi:fido (protein-threonine AMPylation protein)